MKAEKKQKLNFMPKPFKRDLLSVTAYEFLCKPGA